MFSDTPDIISISSHHKIEVLSDSELELLKNGTLRLLTEVGVYYPSQKALTIFADHGANVDWETKIVRIPPDLVKKAMSTAPRSFVLGGREKRFDLTLRVSCWIDEHPQACSRRYNRPSQTGVFYCRDGNSGLWH